MPISKTDAFKEAAAFAQPDTVFVETVVIDHPLLVSPVRLVNSDKNFSYSGDTYVRSQFQLSLPEMSANTGAGLALTLVDIKQDLSADIDQILDSIDPITMMYRLFMTSEVDPQAYLISALEVKSLNLSKRTLSINSGYPDTINKQIPSNKYATTDYPGLR